MLLTSGTALAASSPELSDLIGIKGRVGEAELQDRGYEFHHGAEAKDGKITFWKNDSAKSCIKVLTQDGRYATIEAAPAAACQSEPQ